MPFGEYKDFDDCVAKNSDKKDPKAYCATVQKKVEENIQEHAITQLSDISEATFEVEESESGEKRLMANVRILKAGKSKNNRNYRPSALKKAVESQLFDGIRMFVNHTPDKPPLKRPMQEMVSAIESTSYDEKDQAIDARVEFFDEKFYNYAKRAKKYMGDSINALVHGTRRSLSGGVVEEDIDAIVQPRSVDWVIYPAAGGEILAFESENSEGEEVDWDKLTLDELRKNAPHLVEEMESELKPSGKGPEDEPEDEGDDALPQTRQALEALLDERLQRYVSDQSETAKKKEAAAKLVRDKMETSGLPERTRARVTASFEGITEFDDAKVQKAIDEAKEELKAAKVGPRITGNGASAPTAIADEDRKAYSVRESVEAHFGLKKPATKNDDPEEG